MDEEKVVVVVIVKKEEETPMTTETTETRSMIEGGEKLKLVVVCMSAWCLFTFGGYLYETMTFIWDKNLVRAILSAIPFLLAFLVHLLCLYRYLSNRINAFVANPQTTTRKHMAAIIVKNYLPCVTIYILVHCFVLYHISDEVTRKNELKCVVAFAVVCVLASYGMVFGGYTAIEEELELYQVKQQSASAPIDQHQPHVTEGGKEKKKEKEKEKKKLIEMVKHTSLCCVGPVFVYLSPMILLRWHNEMEDKKPQVLRAAVLYLIPILFFFLVTLIWLHQYALDCINKSFKFNPQSTTERERIIAGNANKHFAFTAITLGVHLFILYIISDEVTRKNELLQLFVLVGLLLSMLYMRILARFAYIRICTDKTQVF